MTDENAIRLLRYAYNKLVKLGFDDICFAPKDGSIFEAIELYHFDIRRCKYIGDEGQGRYWMSDNDNVWPAHPILWRPIKDTERNKNV